MRGMMAHLTALLAIHTRQAARSHQFPVTHRNFALRRLTCDIRLRGCGIEFCDFGGRPSADDLHGVEAVDDVGFLAMLGR